MNLIGDPDGTGTLVETEIRVRPTMSKKFIPPDEVEHLSWFFQTMCRHKLLSKVEEIRLGRKSKLPGIRGKQARDSLAEHNFRLVLSIARGFSGRGIPLDDLIAVGNVGLLRAAEKFDPEKGFRFSTYAVWWIRQSCRREISERSTLIHVPAYLNETNKKGDQSRIKNGARELADQAKAFLVSIRTWDFDSDDRDSSVEISDPRIAPIFDSLENQEVNARLKREIETLVQCDPRLPEILRMRFGLNPTRTPRTLQTIARFFGLSRERVRQIEARGLAILRERLTKGET